MLTRRVNHSGATPKSGIDLSELLQGGKKNRELAAEETFQVVWHPGVLSVLKSDRSGERG